ncbi:hypothetical protein GGR56DRAFT_694659 [Xylariaceae sp. FL0804]|nr:hypothetical protein GGR56DRAFT_694659 [Xylariaceae sp. FL0804]
MAPTNDHLRRDQGRWDSHREMRPLLLEGTQFFTKEQYAQAGSCLRAITARSASNTPLPTGSSTTSLVAKTECTDDESPGCTQSPTHVFKTTHPARLASVLNFAKTPDNPTVPKDRAVCFDCEMGYTVSSYPGGFCSFREDTKAKLKKPLADEHNPSRTSVDFKLLAINAGFTNAKIASTQWVYTQKKYNLRDAVGTPAAAAHPREADDAMQELLRGVADMDIEDPDNSDDSDDSDDWYIMSTSLKREGRDDAVRTPPSP